jgi:aryl-alcohol dehydrogenase-like predicted oxidoreductase
MGEGPNDRGLSRKHVFEQLYASLKRLKMDYVDIFYCHRYDPETPVDETLRTIDDMVPQGKVLYEGLKSMLKFYKNIKRTETAFLNWIKL